MAPKFYLLLFSGAELARHVRARHVAAWAWRLLCWFGRTLAAFNEPVWIDERTMKELGMSRAQAEFELARSPWRHPPF